MMDLLRYAIWAVLAGIAIWIIEALTSTTRETVTPGSGNIRNTPIGQRAALRDTLANLSSSDDTGYTMPPSRQTWISQVQEISEVETVTVGSVCSPEGALATTSTGQSTICRRALFASSPTWHLV
jgi:hypothetical protein